MGEILGPSPDETGEEPQVGELGQRKPPETPRAEPGVGELGKRSGKPGIGFIRESQREGPGPVPEISSESLEKDAEFTNFANGRAKEIGDFTQDMPGGDQDDEYKTLRQLRQDIVDSVSKYHTAPNATATMVNERYSKASEIMDAVREKYPQYYQRGTS